jgi:hypothetical protein
MSKYDNLLEKEHASSSFDTEAVFEVKGSSSSPGEHASYFKDPIRDKVAYYSTQIAMALVASTTCIPWALINAYWPSIRNKRNMDLDPAKEAKMLSFLTSILFLGAVLGNIVSGRFAGKHVSKI